MRCASRSTSGSATAARSSYGLPAPGQRFKELPRTENERSWRLCSTILTTLAVAAVVVVLFLGLWNLSRGKSPNTSQKLMRWRVGLQALAIVIILLFVLVHNYS